MTSNELSNAFFGFSLRRLGAMLEGGVSTHHYVAQNSGTHQGAVLTPKIQNNVIYFHVRRLEISKMQLKKWHHQLSLLFYHRIAKNIEIILKLCIHVGGIPLYR